MSCNGNLIGQLLRHPGEKVIRPRGRRGFVICSIATVAMLGFIEPAVGQEVLWDHVGIA